MDWAWPWRERVLPIAFFTGVPTALINCYAVVRLQVSQGSEILLACTASSAMFIVAVVAVIVDASMSTHDGHKMFQHRVWGLPCDAVVDLRARGYR